MTQDEIWAVLDIHLLKYKHLIPSDIADSIEAACLEIERTTRSKAMGLVYECANQINNMNEEAS